MNISDLAEDYLIDQKEGMRKLGDATTEISRYRYKLSLKAARLLLKSPASMGFIQVFHLGGEMNWLKILKKRSAATARGTSTWHELRSWRGCSASLMPTMNFKKSLCHDTKEGPRGENQTDSRRRFMIIQETISDGLQLSIAQSCHALEVSRSGYFKWLKQPGTILFANSENEDLRDEIQEIALEFPGYGYRRITVELQNRGYEVNHKRVLRLMRQDNLLCLKKKFKPDQSRSVFELTFCDDSSTNPTISPSSRIKFF